MYKEEVLLYLVIGELVPRLLSIGEDLPQDHPQTPDVALCGELSVHDAFRWHPADWQHGVTSDLQDMTDVRHIFCNFQKKTINTFTILGFFAVLQTEPDVGSALSQLFVVTFSLIYYQILTDEISIKNSKLIYWRLIWLSQTVSLSGCSVVMHLTFR